MRTYQQKPPTSDYIRLSHRGTAAVLICLGHSWAPLFILDTDGVGGVLESSRLVDVSLEDDLHQSWAVPCTGIRHTGWGVLLVKRCPFRKATRGATYEKMNKWHAFAHRMECALYGQERLCHRGDKKKLVGAVCNSAHFVQRGA